MFAGHRCAAWLHVHIEIIHETNAFMQKRVELRLHSRKLTLQMRLRQSLIGVKVTLVQALQYARTAWHEGQPVQHRH